jgi:hypothetical protein
MQASSCPLVIRLGSIERARQIRSSASPVRVGPRRPVTGGSPLDGRRPWRRRRCWSPARACVLQILVLRSQRETHAVLAQQEIAGLWQPSMAPVLASVVGQSSSTIAPLSKR